MKKTLLLTVILMTAIIHSSFSAGFEKLPVSGNSKSKESAITSLVVNADVTIVLVNDKNRQVKMIGDETFMKLVSFKQYGNNLVVDASKNRDFKSNGIIYVSAASLENIRVNSAAHIRSSGILEIPDLKININGNCKVHVITTGKVSPAESYKYLFDYYQRDLLLPDRFAMTK